MKNNSIKPGATLDWLDQGPAIVLRSCLIQDPILESDLELLGDDVPWETGWTIKLLQTGEILDVHEETLEIKK